MELYKKRKVSKLFLLLMVGFLLVCKEETSIADDMDPILDPKGNNDIILVLDTSMSMSGRPGKDIIEQVKDSIHRFIDNRVKDGDRIYFMTFDQDVKAYPEVLIDDQNDRDILKKYISMVEAKGQWTFTFKMLSSVFALADKLTKENAESKAKSKRKVAIFIMSDGLDDPPPSNMRDKIHLSDVTNKYEGRGDDWWIYISSFQDLQKSKKLSASYENFKQELGKVSKHIQYNDGADSHNALGDLPPQEEKSIIGKIIIAILLGLLLLFLLFALIMLLKKLMKRELVGRFEYWNHDLLRPDTYNVSITPYQKKELLLGRTVDCVVRIKEYESRYPVKLKAVKKDGKIIPKIEASGNLEISFQNREGDGYLVEGDVFTASNITFKYMADE